jgi:hypothetical protein
MISARRLEVGAVLRNGCPVNIELFYICHGVVDNEFEHLFLVRADSEAEAIRAVRWEHPGIRKAECRGQYGMAEDKDGVVFSYIV